MNEIAYRVITTRYPLWKQMNIIRKGGDDLVEMEVFINGITDKTNEEDMTEDKFIAYCISKSYLNKR
jgi:hypothetical protein